MSHSYIQQLVHIIWSTEDLELALTPPLFNDLLAYITALVKSKNGRIIQTGGASNHVHLLASIPSEISLSEFIKHLKANSSKWIKTQKTCPPHFKWQNGFIAISTQEEQLSVVSKYIQSDKTRHPEKSYPEELLNIMKLQEIEPNEYFLSGSHAKNYLHAIWSTQNRIPYLIKEIRETFYDHVKTILTSSGGELIAIGGIEDHIHLLFELPKNLALSHLIKEIKVSSTHWLKNITLFNSKILNGKQAMRHLQSVRAI